MLSKGMYDISNQWTDLTVSKGTAEKGTHLWAQSVGPFRDFVTWFTEPGELVVDPCAVRDKRRGGCGTREEVPRNRCGRGRGEPGGRKVEGEGRLARFRVRFT